MLGDVSVRVSSDGKRKRGASRARGNEKMVDSILDATINYKIGPDFVNHFADFTSITPLVFGPVVR